MVQRVLQKEGRVRFKAGCPDLRARLFWERGFVLSWGFGASVASRVEGLGGFIALVCLFGSLRVEFLEDLNVWSTTSISPSVLFPTSRAFPFSAGQATIW